MVEVAERIDDKSHYLEALAQVKPSSQEWVNALRKDAAARFEALDFPHRRMEDWRFTNVTPIVRARFQSALQPTDHGLTANDVAGFTYGESAWPELVFVDGFYAPHLSRVQAGIHAGSLAEALAHEGEALRPHLSHYLNGSGSAFTALNTAFLLDGACVFVEKKEAVEAPIHLLFITTGREKETASYPRNLIVLERHSSATIIESYASLAGDTTYLTNATTEIALGEGAKLEYIKMLNEGANGHHLAATRVHQERDSSFRSFAVFQGGKIARNELGVVLDGEGASASLNGLYMTSGEQLVDNATSIEHVKPHCTSWIGYKGVLDDKSHGVFSGKILVRRNAQKTDSNQLNQNMVLSDKATIDTKPLLEIFADDVKCTHGATVGRPPKELVFYFQTRGMSEAMALGMLTYGFADEVVNQIEVDPVRARLEKFVYNKYSPIPA